jgi:hypothetical protein
MKAVDLYPGLLTSMNQYSAFPGEDVDPEGSNYAVGFASPASGIIFNDGSAHTIPGVYVTNSTYAALSMMRGDDYAKKFGGADGTEEDWFKLTVEGFKNNILSNTVEYLLADYSFNNPNDDYIIETWQWLPLDELGKVDSLSFQLSSSDVGEWGMNTPAYMNIDRLAVSPDLEPVVASALIDVSDVIGESIDIDISGVFSDPDDEDAEIVTSLKSNTNESVATASLSGETLTIDLLAEGNTTVTLEAISNNKTAEDAFDVTVISTGIDANGLLSISVYPNPSTGRFRVTAGTNRPEFVSITDMAGREILHTTTHDSGDFIDITSEPAGLYILKVSLADNVVVKTIVKQ